MTTASRSVPLITRSGLVTPSRSEYNAHACFSRAMSRSHTTLSRQSDKLRKFRIRRGPQYPHPRTPTLISLFIFSVRLLPRVEPTRFVRHFDYAGAASTSVGIRSLLARLWRQF